VPGQVSIKTHRAQGQVVVAMCDAELLGRKLKDGKLQITVNEGFYGGDLFDDEQGYYLVRLDSLLEGGVQPLSAVENDVREAVAREQALDSLVVRARSLTDAAARSTLEAAAAAQGVKVQKEGPFARSTTVASLGFVSEAIGAAFSVPPGTVSAPIRTDAAVYVLRTDRRVNADRKAWEVQLAAQRTQVTRGMRDQRIRLFMEGLRKTAKIDDRRKDIQASQRRAVS